jgi:hypothetical protein
MPLAVAYIVVALIGLAAGAAQAVLGKLLPEPGSRFARIGVGVAGFVYAIVAITLFLRLPELLSARIKEDSLLESFAKLLGLLCYSAGASMSFARYLTRPRIGQELSLAGKASE